MKPTRHQITKGPLAVQVTIHMSEMGTRAREPIQFVCPTFKQSVPQHVGLKTDYVDVQFLSVRTLKGGQIFFQGLAYTVVQKGYKMSVPLCGVPVYGLYRKYAETGWIRVDQRRLLEIYLA